jgi:Ca2+-binding EF-hand superfamily protein
MADLGLSDREVKRVMAEADFNDDGEISYAEFIPLAVDLVQ